MKNFLKFLCLVGLFISFAATSTNAQTVDNQTNCTFTIAVQYGDAACGSTGYQTLNVPPGITNLTFPAGSRIMASKGYPLTATNCIYYIGRTNCNGLPTSDSPNCLTSTQAQCPGYSASLNSSFSVITLQ
ncbi:MAG: hypothetical protein AB8H03_17310 [Saprospiraceae bacterium]